MDNLTPEQLNDWLFQRYKGGDRTNWALNAANYVAFVNGLQWLESDAKALEAKNQPALVDNEVTPAIELLVSILTENEPRFSASGRENSDAKLAADVSDLMSYIWGKSEGNEKIERCIRDWEYTGLGAVIAYVDRNADYGRGEVKFADINPQELYIDPNSKREDTEDAAHKLLVSQQTKEQILNWLPKFDFENCQQVNETDEVLHDRHAGENEILNVTDFTHKKYRVIDRYSKFKDKRYKVLDTLTNYEKIFTKDEYIRYGNEPAVIITKSGTEEYITQEESVNKWIQMAEQYGTIVHMMNNGQIMSGVEHSFVTSEGLFAIPGSTTTIKITNKIELLELGILKYETILIDRIRRVLTVGNKLVWNDVMPIQHYPVITFMLHHNRNPYPGSDVGLVKPLQEQLNKIDSLIIAYNTNITNLKVLLPEGTDVKQYEDKWGIAGAQFFTYDAEIGTPVIVNVPPMPAGFYEQRQILINQIQRILGSYSFQDGNTSQAPQTKGGTLLLDEMGLRRSKPKRKKIERFIDRVARVAMELVPKVYTERKVIRIIKPNHGVKEIVFNDEQAGQIINDLGASDYDVIMISGSMMPSNRWARFEVLEGLYEKGILRDTRPILEQIDLPNIDEIMEREDMLNQAQQVIGQMQEQIKQLQGDLQTATRESVSANKQVEVEKFKTSIDKIKNKGESSVLLASQRLNDLVKETKQKQKQSSTNSKTKEKK